MLKNTKSIGIVISWVCIYFNAQKWENEFILWIKMTFTRIHEKL